MALALEEPRHVQGPDGLGVALVARDGDRYLARGVPRRLDLEGRGLAMQVGSPRAVVVALDGAGAGLPLRPVAKLEPHGRGRPEAAAFQHDVDAVHVEEAVGLAAPRRRRGFALLRLCHRTAWLCDCSFFQCSSKILRPLPTVR